MTLPGTAPRTAPAAGPATDPAPGTAPAAAPAADPAPVPVPVPAGVPTPAPAADGEALIAERRRRIDALDARLIDLVRERMSVSAEVQAARVGSGGRRVHLAREMEILRVYGDALGRPGTALAMTLLELCRGKV